MECPSAWEAFWDIVALVSGHCHLCDMRSKIKYEGVQACSKTNGARNTESDPPYSKINEVFHCFTILNNENIVEIRGKLTIS